jgi:hypothetical protein
MTRAIYRKSLYIIAFFVLLMFLCPLAHVQAADVTDSIQVNSSRSYYNRRTGEFSFNATLKNISSDNFPAPLIAVITNLSSAQVSVSNPDGTDSNGNPYFDYSNLLNDDNVLSAGETSGSKPWIFHNPGNVRFNFNAQIISGDGDNVPPFINITNPVHDSNTSNDLPLITIGYGDEGSGLDLSSFNVFVNGVDLSVPTVQIIRSQPRFPRVPTPSLPQSATMPATAAVQTQPSR